LAVLKGENLINDGTALVFYSAAVEAVVSGHFSWRAITLEFPATVCGGIAIDRAFGSLVHVMGAPARLGSGYHITVLVFLCAYLTYLSAELLHVSGVLAAVSGGIYIGRRASFDASPIDRIMVYSFLEIMVFLINVIVFILLGLQFPGILARITDLPTPTLVFWASFVSLAVIALHLAWAMIFGQLNFPSVTRPACTLSKPPWHQSGVIGAALAIPTIFAGGAPFPKCNLILFLVAAAIFLAIILSGPTLPALNCGLGLSGGGHKDEKEVGAARARHPGDVGAPR
jgi:monovalent cation/hydrogen antiporter